jgi:hypothetical protein
MEERIFADELLAQEKASPEEEGYRKLPMMVGSTAFLRALTENVAHPETFTLTTTLGIILPLGTSEQARSSPHRFQKAIHKASRSG